MWFSSMLLHSDLRCWRPSFSTLFSIWWCVSMLCYHGHTGRAWLKNHLKWQILQPAHKMPPPSESPRHWTFAETYFLFKSDLFVCQTILLHAVTYMDLNSICKPHLNTVLISFLLRREDCLSHEPCLGHSWQVTLVWVCSVCVLGLGGLTFKCNQHWDSLIATGQSATTSTDYD